MAAVATINRETNEIIVASRLFLYGTLATNEIGQAIADEISHQYNDAQGQVEITGVVFSVKFDIQYVVIESLRDILFLCTNNRDYRNNFIRIEEKNVAERSFMGFGLGQNVGHWLITDNLGKSTTAAHEYGHSLGLDHPADLDFRGRGIPPIMAPRGSLVDAPLQWNPNVAPGEFGGTMNPIHRKVNAVEVAQIFEPFDLSQKSFITIGNLTNILFDQVGNLLHIS